jgi:hypothetical protein
MMSAGKKQYTAEEIVVILHEIKSVSIEDGGTLDVVFASGFEGSPSEFVAGTFTRELLELIEHHMS